MPKNIPYEDLKPSTFGLVFIDRLLLLYLNRDNLLCRQLVKGLGSTNVRVFFGYMEPWALHAQKCVN